MAENLLNLVKDIIYRFKPQQTPNSIHTKKTTSRHFTTTLLKSRDKERIFKAGRENNMLHMGAIYQKYCWQPTKDNEGQKAVKQHCKNAERKKKYYWIRHKDPSRMTTKWTSITRSAKWSSSDWGKMIRERTSGLEKWMKSVRNGKSMGKNKRPLFPLKVL